MAAPSVMAGQKAARRAAAHEATAASAAAEPVAPLGTSQFDDEAGGEIDEGSARWIFVVLGLMLALAVIANLAAK